MNLMNRGLLGLVLASGLGCGAALHAADEAKPKVTFDEHIAPLLREKCVGCHNGDKTSGGLNLSAYGTLMQGGSSGDAIAPGDADASYLYSLVTHTSEPQMPPKQEKLPQQQLDLLKVWINGGALENAGSKPKVSNKPKVDLALNLSPTGKPEGPPPMPGKLPLEPVVHTARANSITALAASPWAPLVAVGSAKQVLLYNSDTFDLLGVLPFPEGTPHVLKFSRNGGLLLAGGGHAAKSGRVVVWSVKSGERIFEVGNEFDAVLAADISADQTLIALGGPSKVVRIYSTKDGELMHEIKKHTDWIYSLEFSPDSVLLASGDRNGGAFVWEAQTAREFHVIRGHSAGVTDVCWRGDSNILATASEDGTIRFWEMENGTNVKNFKADSGVLSIDFAKDGRLASVGRDKTVKLWNADGGAIASLPALADVGMQVVFETNGQRVISGDWNGELIVSAVDTKTAVGKLAANPAPLAQRIAEVEQQMGSAKQKADQAAKERDAARLALTNLEQQLAQLDARVKNAANLQKPIDEQILRDDQAKMAAQAEVDAATKQRPELEGQVKARTEAAGKAAQAAQEKADDESLKKAAEEAQAAQQQAEQALAALVAKLDAANKTVEQKRAERNAGREQLKKFQAETQAAQQKLGQLQPQLKPAQEQLTAREAAAKAADEAVKSLEAALGRWKEATAAAKQPAQEQVAQP